MITLWIPRVYRLFGLPRLSLRNLSDHTGQELSAYAHKQAKNSLRIRHPDRLETKAGKVWGAETRTASVSRL